MLFIRCYKASGLRRQASVLQLEVLRTHPFSLELIEDLIALGVDVNEVVAAITSSLGVEEASLLVSIAHALAAKQQLRYDLCRSQFDQLLEQHPRNAFILRHAAEAFALCGGRSAEALQAFQQLRAADPAGTRGTDLFGLLLYEAGAEAELNKLAGEVMAALDCSSSGSGGGRGCQQAEGWLLVAMLAALKGDHDRTMRFLEKVRKAWAHS